VLLPRPFTADLRAFRAAPLLRSRGRAVFDAIHCPTDLNPSRRHNALSSNVAAATTRNAPSSRSTSAHSSTIRAASWASSSSTSTPATTDRTEANSSPSGLSTPASNIRPSRPMGSDSQFALGSRMVSGSRPTVPEDLSAAVYRNNGRILDNPWRSQCRHCRSSRTAGESGQFERMEDRRLRFLREAVEALATSSAEQVRVLDVGHRRRARSRHFRTVARAPGPGRLLRNSRQARGSRESAPPLDLERTPGLFVRVAVSDVGQVPPRRTKGRVAHNTRPVAPPGRSATRAGSSAGLGGCAFRAGKAVRF
jgi:hypothetical protein